MNKIEFNEEQREMIARYFPTTNTRLLAEHFGCSIDRIIKEAKSLGLKKDPRHVLGERLKGVEKAWKANSVNGKIVIPKRETTWRENFQMDPEKRRRSVEKSKETLKKLRADEQRRNLFGLPTKTRLRVKTQPRIVANFKHRLRRAGYIIKPGTRIAYYDENTRRDIEKMKNGDKGYVYFEYKPITDKQDAL